MLRRQQSTNEQQIKPVSTSAEPHEIELSVRKGDLTSVQQLFKQTGLGVDTRFGDKSRTLQFLAAELGNTDLMQYLVDSGCNVHALDVDGMDALMVASQQGYLACVKKLISVQASVNTICKNQRTSLVYSCLFRHSEVVKVLQDAGSDPNVGRKNENALLYASSNGQLSIVQHQLLAKANPNVQNGNQSVLGIALQSGHYDCVVQQQQCKANCSNSKEPQLQYALEHNRNDIAKMQLQGKANVHVQSQSNSHVETNPLFLAMSSKMIDVALLLVVCKSDVNAVNMYNEPAILHALQLKNTSLIHTMMENKLFVTSIPISQRGLVLIDACRLPVPRLVDKCLKLKTWNSIETSKKETALLVAIENSHVDIVRVLLQQNLLAPYLSTETTIPFAEEHPVYAALFCKNPEVLALLLTHDADIDIITPEVLSKALQHAIAQGYTSMVEVLLDLGAECAYDHLNRPLLFHAVQNGDLEIVKLLVYNGHVDLEETHETQGTVFVYAAATFHEDIMFFLLDYGVITTAVDGSNKSALQWAMDNNMTRVVERITSIVDVEEVKSVLPPAGNYTTMKSLTTMKQDLQLENQSIHSPIESPIQSPIVQQRHSIGSCNNRSSYGYPGYELADRSPRLANMVLREQAFHFTSPKFSLVPTIAEEEDIEEDDSVSDKSPVSDNGLFSIDNLTLHTQGVIDPNEEEHEQTQDQDEQPPEYTTFLRLNSAAYPTYEEIEQDHLAPPQVEYYEETAISLELPPQINLFDQSSVPF